MMRLMVFCLLICFYLFCKGPNGGDCTPADADMGIELVFPRGGETFTVGSNVAVSWKVDGTKMSQVALMVSTTGLSGPWRNIFGHGIDVPQSGNLCMDTVWTIGQEYEKNYIDYGPSGTTVHLRVCGYINNDLKDESSMITVQR
ncbi:MAG: hypothetical protein JXA18_08445 [Chitinispirillaceae bacterium]|nr:hypothetical protein [Chitinispirillaceae bacterium]